ncbi:MAG TPA: hypothetical protein DF712_17825 [Balneola sp.]|nr:hypothetical protein [Balneola sp.]
MGRGEKVIKYASGSLGIDLIEEIAELVNTEEFENDILSSFHDKFYVLNEKAPNPFWVYSLNYCGLIRVTHDTELIPVDIFNKESKDTECIVNQNIVTIPTEFIAELEWH